MKLPELAVKRNVAMLMVFVFALLIGIIVFLNLKMDLLPDIEPPVINVLTTWPGASASDVEQRVTRKLEDHLSLVEGVDYIISRSLDNLSIVSVKFNWGEDIDVKMGDVRDLIPMAKRDMPDDIEEPILLQITSGSVPVLIMSLTANSSYPGLFHFADRVVKESLSRIKGVGTVLLYGGEEREIQIRMDAGRLEAYRIPVQTVISALERENLNVPAGSLKQGRTEYYLRVPGRFSRVEEISKVVVGAFNGRAIYLGDIATVVDDYREHTMNAWHGEQPSVVMVILKNSDANTIEVSRKVLSRMDEMKRTLFPSDVNYYVGMDTSEFIINSIRNLATSLLAGIVLVFLVTWLFLRRLPASLVVCGAIPFSLIITFIAMGKLGYTINIFTLSALAVASGMVVDNSIVATDQIVHHIELGERRRIAAILGASEVGSALVASTLTTVVVLLPLAFISGLVGVFFRSLTVVMCLAVAASLLVSLTFIPMMGSRYFKSIGEGGRFHRLTEWMLSSLEKTYRSLLDWSLDNRKKIIAMAILLMAFTIWGFHYIGTELTPKPDTGDVEITLTLPEGTRIETTDALVAETVDFCEKNVPEATNIYGFDGQDDKGFSQVAGGEAGSNVATVGMKLVKKKYRERSAFEVAQQVRQWLRGKSGIEKMTVLVSSPIQAMFLGAKPLNIEVFGDDLEEVIDSANRIKLALSTIPGAVDMSLSQKQNRPEIWISVDRQKASLVGVSTAAVAQTLRTYFYGYETRESFWDGEDDYDIRLQLEKGQRYDMAVFEKLMVPSASGRLIRLSTIARVVQTEGPPEIQRKNKQRYVVVQGNVHGRSLGQVTADARTMLENMDFAHGIRVEFGGEIKEQKDSFRQLIYLVLLGIVLVYMVMAGQYEAFLDPFVIMFSIPFALTGVAIAYLATGLYLSLQGMLGVIMLVGIVVNNAIVLLDYVNLLRARGYHLREALLEGGMRRLRPVLMTTLTTFFGMLPMAVSTGEGSEIWRPLAVSVMGGLMVSTLVTLVLVPVVYFLVEDRIRKVPRFQEGRELDNR